jgi:hypothetical protein
MTMRAVTQLLVRTMPVTVAAAVVLLLAAPAALAGTCPPTVSAVVFAVQPTTTQVDTAMTPAVVVDVEDSYGNVITSFNGSVTLSYVPDTNVFNAPQPTGNTVTAINGVATFSELTFSAVNVVGFELQAVAGGVTSAASNSFDIVTQLVQCQPNQACQSGTVSSDGTSGSAVASAASTTDVLTATGGGFPDLSCTTYGGVLTFTVTDRSKIITLTLAASIVSQAKKIFFDVCWGSPAPFVTKNGSTSGFNPANDEYEGLLPFCRLFGPSPCIALQYRNFGGAVVTTVFAPAGDPRAGY